MAIWIDQTDQQFTEEETWKKILLIGMAF